MVTLSLPVTHTPFVTFRQAVKQGIPANSWQSASDLALGSSVLSVSNPMDQFMSQFGAFRFGVPKSKSELSAEGTAPKKPFDWKRLALAGGLMTAGLLTHKLPARTVWGVKFPLPHDWKVFARVLAGFFALQNINKAFHYQPPPWLGAIESVAVISPVAAGLSVKTAKDALLMMPMVAGLVQGSHELNSRVMEPEAEKRNIPTLLPKLALSAGMTVLGLWLYPRVFGLASRTGVMGQEAKDLALASGGIMAPAVMGTCARGCTPGGWFCMTEATELVSSFHNWAKNHHFKKSPFIAHQQRYDG